MQGRRAETVQAARELVEAITPAADVMPEMADAFLSVALLAQVRVQAWDEVLKMPPPADKFLSQTATWRYARAMALWARGDGAGAAREHDAFEAARGKIAAERPWGLNSSGDVMALAAEILAARFSATAAEALPHWEKAVRLQDGLGYDEPPAWYYPVRESLGAALVRAGRGGEGEEVFREGLKRSPRNAWMLFGLMESLKAQSRTEGMAELQKELDSVWSKADLKQTLEAM
jgi:hypothetical protein